MSTLMDLLTVERFRSWLRDQDPKTTYRYADNCGCVLARFCRAHGYEVSVGSRHVRDLAITGSFIELSDQLAKAVVLWDEWINREQMTYGQVLAWLDEHVPEQLPASLTDLLHVKPSPAVEETDHDQDRCDQPA